MKKITIASALFCMLMTASQSAFSQKEGGHDIFSKLDVEGSSGKTNGGAKETVLNGKWQFKYDWLFFQAKLNWPLKKNQSDEKFTLITLGYGQQSEFNRDMKLMWGIGVTGMIAPVQSVPKTYETFVGGSLYGNLSSQESNFDAELGATYTVKPRGSNYDWSNSIAMINAELTKGLGQLMFIGVGYDLTIDNMTEVENPYYQFNGSISTMNTGTVKPFIGMHPGNGMVKFKAGIELKRTKHTWSDINDLPQFNAWNESKKFYVGVEILFNNR